MGPAHRVNADRGLLQRHRLGGASPNRPDRVTHLMVTVTSMILSVVMRPVMWCLTAVSVRMLGAELEGEP